MGVFHRTGFTNCPLYHYLMLEISSSLDFMQKLKYSLPKLVLLVLSDPICH